MARPSPRLTNPQRLYLTAFQRWQRTNTEKDRLERLRRLRIVLRISRRRVAQPDVIKDERPWSGMTENVPKQPVGDGSELVRHRQRRRWRR